MRRYQVNVDRTIEYSVEVDAESEEEAMKIAEDMDVNEMFQYDSRIEVMDAQEIGSSDEEE